MEFVHKSVLLNEAVDALSVKRCGIYVDATAGGGGHASKIVQSLSDDGRLIAVDRDPDAVAVLKRKFENQSNVTVVNDVFDNIKSILQDLSVSGVDGILADLGVSSFQLDSAERGFSFHRDAPLDMRMSKSGFSAYDAVNTLPQDKLKQIIYSYGEEKYAPSIAKNIVKQREIKPIETTFELCDIISASMPAKAKRDGHPARRTFQALRIYVNRELEMLPNALNDMFDCLNADGVLAVITFHSLEDRIVKNAFNEFCKGCTCPPDFPVCVCGKKPRGELLFKSKTPCESEIDENPRSRSARLRAVRKL
ncbi:MAG: 16S rRNA (cytosine(1402)-N(4))-methyltransferase RsmH [Clostridiales bacterium]|nr:16S rRNA (cytosine(1402)-N(4))-methyltransferase RsmH [Clostridiales bacterium]